MSDTQSTGSTAPVPYPAYPAPPPPAPRSVSFYVAIFLALLLVVSVGLNVLLLVVSAIGSVSSFGGSVEEDGNHRIVAVGGSRNAKGRILRVPIDGAISEAGAPLIGGAGGTVTAVRRALRVAAEDESIRGVLLDINSPGGGVTDSDEVHRLITNFRQEHPTKPVLALLGDIAASGGYYIAVACQQIMARPTTITGSIGVIMQGWNVAEAMQKLGVDQVTIVSERTPHKDLLSATKPVDPQELTMLRRIVDEMYDRFVQVVDEGRPGLDREQVIKLADGRIYSAGQAKESGLVDMLGTVEDALRIMSQMEHVGTAQLVELRRLPTLLEGMFGARSPATPLESMAREALGSVSARRLLYYWSGPQ